MRSRSAATFSARRIPAPAPGSTSKCLKQRITRRRFKERRMADTTHPLPQAPAKSEPGFVRLIGLVGGTMVVGGSMIGWGSFMVAADIARQTGSSGGLLLTWILTGLLTVTAALSYGELAALFPHAGGQYIYLREAYSPLWGFLYGWTLFLVIQTGTIAAVAVAFARYLGVIFPAISAQAWIVQPIPLGSKYAISLSAQQFVGVLMILLLTFLNTRGVRLGKLIQNIFTRRNTLALPGLLLFCGFAGVWHADRDHALLPRESRLPLRAAARADPKRAR